MSRSRSPRRQLQEEGGKEELLQEDPVVECEEVVEEMPKPAGQTQGGTLYVGGRAPKAPVSTFLQSLLRSANKLPKSFEEQVPPVARASQGHQHRPEPREPRLFVTPNALQPEPVGARMVKRRLAGKQTTNQYQPAAGRALDKSFSVLMFDFFVGNWQPSLDAWNQELGPVGTMLAQDVLELDYGSQASFGGKVAVVGLDPEAEQAGFLTSACDTYSLFGSLGNGFAGLTMQCRAAHRLCCFTTSMLLFFDTSRYGGAFFGGWPIFTVEHFLLPTKSRKRVG